MIIVRIFSEEGGVTSLLLIHLDLKKYIGGDHEGFYYLEIVGEDVVLDEIPLRTNDLEEAKERGELVRVSSEKVFKATSKAIADVVLKLCTHDDLRITT